MVQGGEVALFIDFENIRYGFLNVYDQEPDPQELMAKAHKYGRVVVASAYADFTEHPPYYRRSLEVAGIATRDIPKRGREKRSADMAMLMDIFECLLDRPSVDTCVLMTGDSDFIRITAYARHRFGKKVIISGVPGTVSRDLVKSANAEDLLVIAPEEEISEQEKKLVQLINYLERNRPYLTFKFIYDYAISPTGMVRLSDSEATDLLNEFKKKQILQGVRKELEDGRIVSSLVLNREHPVVKKVLGD